MLTLLGILASALIVGRLARRVTPLVEVMLLGLIAAIVLAEFASWHYTDSGGIVDIWDRLFPDRP